MKKQTDMLYLTATCAYDGAAKRAFHRTARRYLRMLADFLGLKPSEYDLRSNQGGIAVSGEVTLHSDGLYVQVSQSCMGPQALVLYRTCEGRRDYCGRRNHYVSAEGLLDTADLARRCMVLMCANADANGRRALEA